jgi:hypothetical protein
MKLFNILETVMHEESSEAADQAHELGLVSKGWGRWADPQSGDIVAKTIQGKLVKVDPKGDDQQSDDETNDYTTSVMRNKSIRTSAGEYDDLGDRVTAPRHYQKHKQAYDSFAKEMPNTENGQEFGYNLMTGLLNNAEREGIDVTTLDDSQRDDLASKFSNKIMDGLEKYHIKSQSSPSIIDLHRDFVNTHAKAALRHLGKKPSTMKNVGNLFRRMMSSRSR